MAMMMQYLILFLGDACISILVYSWGLLELVQNQPSTSTYMAPQQRHKKKRAILHASLRILESLTESLF